MSDRYYVVAYDISDQRRGRRIFKLMQGYGDWLQFSVFQCRLTAQRHAELVALLDGIVLNGKDHVVIVDLGPADGIEPRITSLGKPFSAMKREPVIV